MRNMEVNPIFRSELMYYTEHNYYMEKRQLFLRSYQFCRKRSVAEKIRRSFVRVKKLISLRFRSSSARKFRKLVWTRLRCFFFYTRRQRFRRLHNHKATSFDCPYYCFW